MGIATLSLAIDVKSSATTDVHKLILALNKNYCGVKDFRKQKRPDKTEWECFGEGVKRSIEDPLHAALDAVKGLLDGLGPVGAGLAATASELDFIGADAVETGQHVLDLEESAAAEERRRRQQLGV